jgi:Mn2+/Fe2+ NRAMP family transporter
MRNRNRIVLALALIFAGILAGILGTLASMVETREDAERQTIERRDADWNEWLEWRRQQGI